VSEDKLLYFAFRGRGEPIRIIYALAQVPLKDERVPISLDHWMNIKKGERVYYYTCNTLSQVYDSAYCSSFVGRMQFKWGA